MLGDWRQIWYQSGMYSWSFFSFNIGISCWFEFADHTVCIYSVNSGWQYVVCFSSSHLKVKMLLSQPLIQEKTLTQHGAEFIQNSNWLVYEFHDVWEISFRYFGLFPYGFLSHQDQ